MISRVVRRLPQRKLENEGLLEVIDRTTIDQPLLVHRENHLGIKRVLELYEDRIRIRGSQVMSASWDFTYPLQNLSPVPVTGKVRQKGLGIVLSAVVVWAVLAHVLYSIPLPNLFSASWGLFWFVPVVLLIMVFLLLPRYRYANFLSKEGGGVIFGLENRPPGRKTFDSFVAKTIAQIQQCQNTTGDGSTS